MDMETIISDCFISLNRKIFLSFRSRHDIQQEQEENLNQNFAPRD